MTKSTNDILARCADPNNLNDSKNSKKKGLVMGDIQSGKTANYTALINLAADYGYKVIVDKSTVPVGTAEKVTEIIKEHTNYDFDVVSNPEFLKQGNAVDDFLSPDRVVIGSNSEKATAIMQEIYSPFFRTGNRVIVMDVKSAEMTKL